MNIEKRGLPTNEDHEKVEKKESFTRSIILLDGPKGSGKTTVGKLLEKKIANADYLSLDEIRRAIPDAKATTHFNQMAFDKLLEKLNQAINEGNIAIIDCGLTMEKLDTLEKTVTTLGVGLYKYSLNTSPETLFDRVAKRDLREGKRTDKERFDYVYQLQQAKEFRDYTTIDTELSSPNEIVSEIIAVMDKE